MRLLLAGFLILSHSFLSRGADPEFTPQEWQKVVDKATAFLKKNQEDNGGWSTKQSIGITGLVTTGLLKVGLKPSDDTVARGLKYIEGLINPKAGHIAGSDPVVKLQNYVTSVNLMALVEAKKEAKYQAVIKDAVGFLKKLQWDDGENKNEKDDFFGGAGYDSKSRPDLSNTQFFMDALAGAGVKADDEAFKKALVFVSRCQNLDSEHNRQPWAGKINDGSFIYSAAGGGSTKVDEKATEKLPGYGSMTYAGIKSMIYCGLSKDDIRMKAALTWIKKNYTLEANPGMPPQYAQRGLYYYYHTMAKTLHLLGEEEITDDKGGKHNWKKDLFLALAQRQKADGSWTNESDRWMEGDPNLVTAYVLMALSYCRP